MALNTAIFYKESTDWLHGNQGIQAQRCHHWDVSEQGSFQAQGTVEGKLRTRCRWPPATGLGVTNWKGKIEKETRQQTGGIKVSGERVHKSAIHPQSDAICFTNSAFHLRSFLFSPICNPCEITYFPFLSSISKCLLLSSTLCSFLPTHYLLTSILFSPDSSLPSLTQSYYVGFFLPVWAGLMRLLPHACSLEKKNFYSCFTFQLWMRDGQIENAFSIHNNHALGVN